MRDNVAGRGTGFLWSDLTCLFECALTCVKTRRRRGPDFSTKFCADNGYAYIVRSHEIRPGPMFEHGYELDHGGKTVTVFSASNYGGVVSRAFCSRRFDVLSCFARLQQGNHASYAILRSPDEPPQFHTFYADAAVRLLLPGVLALNSCTRRMDSARSARTAIR